MSVDLENIYVKRWLTGLSEGTKETYPALLTDFLTFLNMNPTEIINKRMHDLTSTDLSERCFFEDKWRAYKESLEATGLNSDSKVHDRIKVASSFFTRNSLPLNLPKGNWKSTQKQQVIAPKLKLNINDVKAMYGHAVLRDKCLLLILAQSGFSEIDISELKIQDIKGLYEMAVNEHYFIEKPRDKNTHVQATCLSYEFLHDLRAFLAERGNPTTGFIFTSLTTDKGVSAIDTRRINESMQTLAGKTFGETSEKAKEFQTRMLRSVYNGALLHAKPVLSQEIKDLMMGHDREGARSHYQYDDLTIKEAYISVFENLTINGLQSRTDIIQLKEEFYEKFGKQQEQIEDMKNVIETLSKLLDAKYPELVKPAKETHKGTE